MRERLLAELSKIRRASPDPINQDFILGYLCYDLERHPTPELCQSIFNFLNLIRDNLITQDCVIQSLPVLKFHVLKASKQHTQRRIMEWIQRFINELVFDNEYLKKKYYDEFEMPEIQKKVSLGVSCPICETNVDEKQLCLINCGHMFHISCFNQYAKSKIQQKLIPFTCPQEYCSGVISNSEVNEYLSKNLREKYEEFTFQKYVDEHVEDTSWCPTPGCRAVFAFDKELQQYRCPACRKHYCLSCKAEYHTDMTCKQYMKIASMNKVDRQFIMFARGAKYKQCPSCKHWVSKDEGCDHMTCRCKYQFCYICGGKYQHCKCTGHDIEDVDVEEEQFARLEQDYHDEIALESQVSQIKPIQRKSSIIRQPIPLIKNESGIFTLEKQIKPEKRSFFEKINIFKSKPKENKQKYVSQFTNQSERQEKPYQIGFPPEQQQYKQKANVFQMKNPFQLQKNPFQMRKVNPPHQSPSSLPISNQFIVFGKPESEKVNPFLMMRPSQKLLQSPHKRQRKIQNIFPLQRQQNVNNSNKQVKQGIVITIPKQEFKFQQRK